MTSIAFTLLILVLRGECGRMYTPVLPRFGNDPSPRTLKWLAYRRTDEPESVNVEILLIQMVWA